MGKRHRVGRISEELRKILSSLIISDIKDPRLSPMTSITGIDVTDDYSYAKVYISVFGSDKEKADSLNALKSAAGYIRSESGKRIKMRRVPEFIFELDHSVENGLHIDQILRDIKEDNHNDDDDDEK